MNARMDNPALIVPGAREALLALGIGIPSKSRFGGDGVTR